MSLLKLLFFSLCLPLTDCVVGHDEAKRPKGIMVL